MFPPGGPDSVNACCEGNVLEPVLLAASAVVLKSAQYLLQLRRLLSKLLGLVLCRLQLRLLFCLTQPGRPQLSVCFLQWPR